MVSIKNLKKSFGSNEVLKDISIDIKAGEIVSVLGPSGSGKSTFIRCINLLEKPTSGEIWFEGCELTGDNKENLKQMRERIGMVFQQFYAHDSAKKYNVCACPRAEGQQAAGKGGGNGTAKARGT